ncbi:MAG TPA: hypothetical protein GXX14_10795 [Clostridiaceae bacterium]|nr:hypothetical protein [Clostridiaceae bacterium]
MMKIGKYNVKWNTQSRNSGESMPCGGFDAGANVWVENNEILMYIDRSGSFDENNQMLKLGRFRFIINPNPFKNFFSQELVLENGYVKILGDNFEMIIWFDALKPVCHVDVSCSGEMEIIAQYESWRTKERPLPQNERMAALSYNFYPGEVITYPDEIITSDNSITFFHRNRNDKLLFDFIVKQQNLMGIKDRLYNPQKNLTFGGRLFGEDCRYAGRTSGSYAGIGFEGFSIKSSNKNHHRFFICFNTEQAESIKTWLDNLQKLCDIAVADTNAFIRTQEWWRDFWNRSYIYINPDKDENDTGFQISRNYALFRYMLGCNAYGNYPTKFNGGLFTSDPCYSVGEEHYGKTPDYRMWGGGSFTAQNQRLVYWPMLKSGDFDMMIPQFEFYRRLLNNAELRTKEYWGHKGCSFAEHVENFGLPPGWCWGFEETEDTAHKRPKNFDSTEQIGPWIRYEYINQVEFAFMIIKYYRYSGQDISRYIPFIESAVTFFFEHYEQIHEINTTRKFGDDGRLVIYPSTALETYKNALNPTDVIAGLKAILTELSNLDEYVNAQYYRQLIEKVPDFKIIRTEGIDIISPAYSWTAVLNCELPQLYPVFPYELLHLGDENLELAINTWKVAPAMHKSHISWHQDGIFTARMGLKDEAREINTRKLADSGRRFPAFWGPGHDWVPDHNWGGSGMIGLQDMLVQEYENTVYLLPAWPEEWNVDFKLHLPGNAVIECSFKDGKASWNITGGNGGKKVVLEKF